MKIQNVIQVTLEQEEIDTLINVQMLLKELCNIMEDTHSTTLTTIVDEGFENKYQTWTECALTEMLEFTNKFWEQVVINFTTFFFFNEHTFAAG